MSRRLGRRTQTGPTKRQQEILDYIREFRSFKGYAPSIREVAAALDIAPQTLHAHLVAMESKGLIERAPGVQRGLKTP